MSMRRSFGGGEVPGLEHHLPTLTEVSEISSSQGTSPDTRHTGTFQSVEDGPSNVVGHGNGNGNGNLDIRSSFNEKQSTFDPILESSTEGPCDGAGDLSSDVPDGSDERPECRDSLGIVMPKFHSNEGRPVEFASSLRDIADDGSPSEGGSPAFRPHLHATPSLGLTVLDSHASFKALGRIGSVGSSSSASASGVAGSQHQFVDQVGVLLQQHHKALITQMDSIGQRQERLLRQLFEGTKAGAPHAVTPASPSTPGAGQATVQQPLTAAHTAQLLQQTSNVSLISASGPPADSRQSTSGGTHTGAVGTWTNLHSFVGTKTLSFIQEDETRRNQAQSAASHHGSVSGVKRTASQVERLYMPAMGCCRMRCASLRCVQRIVRSNAFEVFFAVMIMTNSILIGMEVEWMARDENQSVPVFFRILNWVYNSLFLAELILRVLSAGGFRKFLEDSLTWAVLDIMIVLFSLLEMSFDVLVLASELDIAGVDNVSNIRIVRVLRMTRLVRTLRIPRIIRIFSALRTMVFSIMMTFKTLLWALVLLMIIMYVFGIVFTQSAVDRIVEDPVNVDPRIREFWSNLPTSMVTLYKTITNGVSWHEAVEPWGSSSSPLVLLFLAYVFFTQFAIVNVITGMFCHTAIETAYTDPDLVAQSLISCKNQYMVKLRDLFESIDDDHSGQITITELEKLLKDDTMQAYFQALDLDYNDAWTLFKLLDEDGSNAIDVDEFVMGCMRLKGAARNIDMARLNADTRWMIKRLSKFMRRVETHLGFQPGMIASLEHSNSNLSRVNTPVHLS